MPSAALPLNRLWLARCGALLTSAALVGACSVYSEDLVDDSAAGITSGADGAAAGHGDSGGTGSAGKPSENGGTDSVVPSEGGEASLPTSDAGGTDAAAAGAGGRDTNVPGGSSGAPSAGGVGGSSGAHAGGSSGGGAGGMPAGDLIDGFEDEDLTLEPSGGRGGVWYLFDDLTVGTAGPTPFACSPLSGAPAALGAYAMHITATGFTAWGTGLGVDFRAGKKVYDASKYSGIRFWAKVGAGKNTRHRVQLADATTDKAGGKCNPAPTAPDGAKCDDHFGINETFTTTWTQYVVRFEDLGQIGWGNAAPALDKSAVYGLQVTAKAKLEVDLWLDQIEFF